jgi:uncharacterized coiled-coil DUF342 family protein
MNLGKRLLRLLSLQGGTTGSTEPSVSKSTAAWEQSCALAGAKLAQLGSGTEEDFLALGNDLQTFYTRAQAMGTLSQAVVELMTGQDVQTAGADLNTTLSELDTYLSESSSQFNRMSAVFDEHLKALKKITSGLESFQMLSLNLSILGFLTRVENAHIENLQTGFGALTDDVKKLSASIKEKTVSIRTTCEDISSGVAKALDKVAFSDRTHTVSARSAHAQAAQSESLLAKRYGHAVKAAHIIDQRIGRSAADISDIVMSLQFHDITRQQIQHVQAVLDNLQTMLRDDAHHLDRQAAVMGDTLELQRAQIAQSRDEFGSAVATVIESLESLAEDEKEILSQIGQVAWASDAEGVSTLQGIKDGIEAMINHIMVAAQDQAELNTTAQEVGSMVAQMSAFVQDIHSIGLNLEFLALNARIKAAHLGVEGVALDTISGSIYELSHDTRGNTVELTDILERLAELSVSFTQDLMAGQERQTQIMQDLMEKLTHLTDILSDIADRVQAKTNEITDMGQALIKDIIATAENISVHERVTATLGEAEDIMLQTVQDARRICPHGWQGAAMEFLQQIDQLYTMHSERRVHARHVDKDGATASAENEETSNIEFF